MYKISPKNILGNITSIIRISDGACIPIDERNIDYKEYLKWVSKGNKAEELDLGGIE